MYELIGNPLLQVELKHLGRNHAVTVIAESLSGISINFHGKVQLAA